ncbi:MAG: hypothetical protein WC901_00965 [Candidatus Margulisiibacteriota bacterium]
MSYDNRRDDEWDEAEKPLTEKEALEQRIVELEMINQELLDQVFHLEALLEYSDE